MDHSSSETFEISEPRTDELPAVLDLCAQCLHPQAQDIDEHVLTNFRQHGKGLCLIARKEDEVAAVLLCEKQGSRYRILFMHVKESCQSQGLDRQMLDKVMVKLNARGAHTFCMPQTDPDSSHAWEEMKWQGQCDLRGIIPLGRQLTCPL